MFYKIKWRNNQQSTYLYGSVIQFHHQRVNFSNALMPPGTMIYEWKSRTNYQVDRMEPSLPLLVQGKGYLLELILTEVRGNQPYVQILFYNRLNHLVDSLTMKESSLTFIYPREAYYYYIQLINASGEGFVFDHLLLSQLAN